jgi:hypothetical protein
MKNKKINQAIAFICLIATFLLPSCSDYLDVYPENVPDMSYVFKNRTTAERFLFTCYSYLPNPADPLHTPGLISSRECWFPYEGWFWIGGDANGANLHTWLTAQGLQNTNNPYLNYWDGGMGGTNLFIALRDCNIFLENIDQAHGVDSSEKMRWKAEVKFLKAYYHFYLLRMYGPIPIIRENLPIGSGPDKVRTHRDPVEDVARYIVELLDEAAEILPPLITNRTQELGRITKPIALAVKAQTLVWIASPLFNGTSFNGFKDNRDMLLFPQNTSKEALKQKWQDAAQALKKAIDCAEQEGNHRIFYFTEIIANLTDPIKVELGIRGAVSERWNSEIIWGSTKDETLLQQLATVRIDPESNVITSCALAPALDAIELYYTKNGLPMNEDREYAPLYTNMYKTRTAKLEDKDFIQPGYETASLHFNREPRFYASITFDGGYYFGYDSKQNPVQMLAGTTGGRNAGERYSITGYFPKKLVNRESKYSKQGWTTHSYAYPYIRLADLYLLYAEALNEVKDTPDDEVYHYIDQVRKRAGLNGVKETWTAPCSLHPEYINSQARMQEIIHRERLIELAFENAPYWDILRWREAETRWNRPVRGWNVFAPTPDDFYEVTTIANPGFTAKEYLAPIAQGSLDRNPNLVQNPGWQ